MRKHNLIWLLSVAIVLLLSSCNTTKFVPQDKYLLNKAKVRVTDEKSIDESELKNYLRQKQNSEILGFWKLQLHVYNTQGKDSTKWINRQIRKIGEAPEVYNPDLTSQSISQLKKAMDNKGYFNSEVDTIIEIKSVKQKEGKPHRADKLNITYSITANQPYRLRNYTISLDNADLNRVASRKINIEDNMLFSADVLDKERQRIATRMRWMGYYYFDRDFLKYEADSSFNSFQVDCELKLQDYIEQADDSTKKQIFTKYKIAKVLFITTDDSDAQIDTSKVDTVYRNKHGYGFITAGKKYINKRTLVNQCQIEPGQYYSEYKVEKTYAKLNSLSIVKYVNIIFKQVSDDELVCAIFVSKSKQHSVSAELEGTYSAGDWGIAAGATYTNRNLFRGAEELTLSARASYEWRKNGGQAIEAKAVAGLRFPTNVKINVSYSFQNRPNEFSRTIANASLNYLLTTQIKAKNENKNSAHARSLYWYHNFNLLEISYVYLPWIDDAFKTAFLNPYNSLRYSYEDHFIMDWSYSGSFSSYHKSQPLRNYITFLYGIETAGNALYALSKLAQFPQNEDGKYQIFKIPFAQYAKADLNFTFNQIFDEHNRLVYHAALGLAAPFGNADVLPFEKRYFSGGGNSVRGWNIRALGPGGYQRKSNRIDYYNQSGDVKLDLSLEYRLRLVWALELALFTDAGNIWTIKDYEAQPEGQFKITEFYKQLGWSYGLGVRLNFDFLVLRLDLGIKLHDPARVDDSTQWRTVANGLGWKDDMTLHFAIGYPF